MSSSSRNNAYSLPSPTFTETPPYSGSITLSPLFTSVDPNDARERQYTFSNRNLRISRGARRR